MNKPEIHWQVLSKNQKKLLPKLKFLKEQGFYLAGGTALALQIGHRTSLDFDFYKEKEFRAEAVSAKLSDVLAEGRIIREAEGTVIAEIDRQGENGISLFHSVRPFVAVDGYLNLVSLEDIAAMKLLAIADRGARRDFIDLYFLISRFGLEEIFGFLKEKHPRYDGFHALLGLTYFEDADGGKEEGRYRMLKSVPEWRQLKKFFVKKALDFKKKML
jgi:hypothetical protein